MNGRRLSSTVILKDSKSFALAIQLVPFSPIACVQPFRYGRFARPDALIERDVQVGIIQNMVYAPLMGEVFTDEQDGLVDKAFTALCW